MGWSTWEEHRRQEWEDTVEFMFREHIYDGGYIELARKYVGDTEVERFQRQFAAYYPDYSGIVESHMEHRDDGIVPPSEDYNDYMHRWGVG